MCYFFLAVFRLNVPLTVQFRGGWGCFLAGADPFVERLAGEDAFVALGLELLDRLGAAGSSAAPS